MGQQLSFDDLAARSAPVRRPRSTGLRIDVGGRECGECRHYKPWDDFHVSRTTTYGHVTICKPCMSDKVAAITAAKRAARPPKITPACSIAECGKDAKCRTWCNRHYELWRKYGSPSGPSVERIDLPGENWRPIPTFEGLYEASDRGRVWSVLRETATGRFVGGQFLKEDLNDPRGYVRARLKRPEARRQQHFSVHRLVLWAFTGENPADLDTRHLDGNPRNNSLTNLAFGTASENAHDRVRHGTWVNNNRFIGVTKCIHGHDFDEANTYWRPTGGRSCRACARERAAAARAAA